MYKIIFGFVNWRIGIWRNIMDTIAFKLCSCDRRTSFMKKKRKNDYLLLFTHMLAEDPGNIITVPRKWLF